MTRKLFILGLLCLAIQTSFAQNLNIAINSSLINWTGHAEVGSYSPAGTIKFKDGKVDCKNDKITGAVLNIDMKSMQQDNVTLLGHLKSDDFFDVEKYPLSTITITKIENGKAYGTLTIKGKTQPFNCPVTIASNNGKLAITGTCTIDRTSYGITYNSGSFFSGLGDKAIRNTFDVTFSIVVLR